MNEKIIIAIDAMGGENSPAKNIDGISIFIKKKEKEKKDDFFFNIYGNELLINNELNKYKISKKYYKIFIHLQ